MGPLGLVALATLAQLAFCSKLSNEFNSCDATPRRMCEASKDSCEPRCTGSAPVLLDVYMESLCPDCRDFFRGQLYGTWLLLGDIMNITLVPYGNAREQSAGDQWNFTCQHGPNECKGNMLQACLIYFLPNSNDHIPIFNCMESAANPITAAQQCTAMLAPKQNWQLVDKCASGPLGNKLMHKNAQRTDALRPEHQYVPWIVFNGEHTETLQNKAESALLALVCGAYKGQLPAVCGK
ncbi:gamma-interferon-inducible lysosomal thiol reductase-like [Lampetra fluviatilis]